MAEPRAQQLGALVRLFADAATVVARGGPDLRLLRHEWHQSFGDMLPKPSPAPATITFYPGERMVEVDADGNWTIRRWPREGAASSLLERTLDQARERGEDVLDSFLRHVLNADAIGPHAVDAGDLDDDR